MKGPVRAARRLAAAAFYHSGAFDVYAGRALRDRAVVLMYHRVLEDSVASSRGIEPGMFVTRRTLDCHVRMLRHSHVLVTMDQLGDWLAGRTTFDKPPCAITFDDGWVDNYETAFPVLLEHGAAATIFLITGAIGGGEMLQWAQVHEMERHGIAFGSHTVTHALLGQCDPSRIREELSSSRATLQDKLARPSRWFCFPKGSHSDTACSLVREYYEGAVTTLSGWVSRGDDPARLRRVGIHDDMARTPSMFAWRLALLR